MNGAFRYMVKSLMFEYWIEWNNERNDSSSPQARYLYRTPNELVISNHNCISKPLLLPLVNKLTIPGPDSCIEQVAWHALHVNQETVPYSSGPVEKLKQHY